MIRLRISAAQQRWTCVGALSTLSRVHERTSTRFRWAFIYYLDVTLSIFIPCEWHVRKNVGAIHSIRSTQSNVSLSSVDPKRKCVLEWYWLCHCARDCTRVCLRACVARWCAPSVVWKFLSSRRGLSESICLSIARAAVLSPPLRSVYGRCRCVWEFSTHCHALLVCAQLCLCGCGKTEFRVAAPPRSWAIEWNI